MPNNKKKLIENIFLMGGVQIISSLIPLATLPYLAVTLGPTGLGKMAFALAIAQIATIITDYGFNLSAPRLVAINKEKKSILSSLFIEITIIRTALCATGFIILVLTCQYIDLFRNDQNLFLLAYITVFGNILFPQWLFIGLERMRAISLIQVVVRIGALGLLLGYVKSESDLTKAVLIQSCVFTAAGMLALPIIFKEINFRKSRIPSASELKLRLIEGFAGFISMLAVSVISSSNVIIISILSTPDIVARYHVAEKMIRAVQIMYSPIINAMYPYFSRIANSDPELAAMKLRKLIIYTTPISLTISVAVFFVGPQFISLAFGTRYSDSMHLLQLFSPLPFIVATSSILGNLNMLSFGQAKAYGKIYATAVVVNFLTFPLMTLTLNEHGSVVANILIETFIAIAMWISIKKRSSILKIANNN